ncbi:MAG: EamA family transporter [Actinobacteria bacterium]|nr:EamA family transporter [Actinomycetota bacterium]
MHHSYLKRLAKNLSTEAKSLFYEKSEIRNRNVRCLCSVGATCSRSNVGHFLRLSALLFSIHILLLSTWSKDFDAYALTVMQLLGCALLCMIPTSIQGFKSPPDSQVWAVIIFTAVFATAIAFVVQTWAQARISATKVAVILTTEVVFAAIFSVALGREPITLRLLIGGTLVLVAMIAIVQPRLHETMDER